MTAADLALRLRRAVTTASNDDCTKPNTEERRRHVERLMSMQEAAEFLEALYD